MIMISFRSITSAKNSFLALTIMMLTACGFCTSGFAQTISVKATLQPTSVMSGEKVIYTITVTSNGTIGNVAPETPKLSPDLGIRDFNYVNYQSQQTIVNGVVKSTVNYNYVLVPTKVGTFTIPPSSITVGNVLYKSAPTTLTVSPVPQISGNTGMQTQTNSPTQPQMSSTNSIPPQLKDFVVAPVVQGNPELQRNLTGCIIIKPDYKNLDVYQGEQTYLTYHLLIDENTIERLNLNINGIQLVNIGQPEFKQFIKDEIFPVPQNMQLTDMQFGNKTYKVAPLLQVALTPTKTGELVIEPFKIRLLLRMARSYNADPFSLLDDFGFGGRTNAIDLVALSPEIKYTVKPLPTDKKPADFSGAVGDFAISATIDKTMVKSNDDIVNLQLVISGKGDAATISAPEFNDTPYLKLLEPPRNNVKKTINANNERISSKTFDYLLRPLTPGKTEIPALSLSVFNTQKKAYDILKTTPLSLEITTGTLATAMPTTISTSNNNNTTTLSPVTTSAKTAAIDIAYLHEGQLKNEKASQRTSIVIILCSSLFAVVLTVIGQVIRRKNSLSDSDIKLRKSKSAISSYRSDLSKLKKQLGDSTAFYESMGQTIRQYFANKFQTEALGLTTEEIERRLLDTYDFPHENATAIIELLEVCDGMKYSYSSGRSIDAMKKDLIDAKQLIEEAEKYL